MSLSDFLITAGVFTITSIVLNAIRAWWRTRRGLALDLSTPEFGELIAIRSSLFKGEGGIVIGTYGGTSQSPGYIVVHNAFAPEDSTHVRASSYLGRIVCGYGIRRESIPDVLRHFANGWDMSNIRR